MDLMQLVCPEEGLIALLCLRGKREVRQFLLNTKEEVYEKGLEFNRQGWNVYFSMASFKDEANGRTKPNVRALKSFWVDIDCGPTKAIINEKTRRPDGYATQLEGVKALTKFCEDTSLPTPTLVNSGNGVHAYWPLTEEITCEQWEPVSEKLKALCIEHDFYIDPNVFEVARVMRMPDTYNYRNGEEKLASVKSVCEPISFSEFSKLLGVEEAPTKLNITKRPMSELGARIQASLDSSFSKIMVRSLNGEGCGQIADCYINRSTLSEPRWFNALSIAKHCSDRDKAIHKLSEGHPDYDYEIVEKKANHIKGPHSCDDFEKNNPGGCEGCKHKGKITNPLALGKVLPQQSEVEITVKTDLGSDVLANTYTVPILPFPYARGKNGGVYRIGEEDEEPTLVYDYDLYIVKRMHDIEHGDCSIIRLHLPMDGVREFVLSNIQIADKNELRKQLAKKGVLCTEKKSAHIHAYLTTFVNYLITHKKAENMRPQFGWAEKDTVFILGDREITKDGIYHSPPAPDNLPLATKLHSSGSYEKWKEVFNLYGREGHEPHAFAALSAFGSPLFKFTGHSGAIINLVSSGSGTGKTTALHMINSVYGHPKELCGIAKDTMASRFHKLGVMNNLTCTFDELTNTTGLDFSDLGYGISQGRGWDRMESGSNKMRVNNTSWQLFGVASSNSAFAEKLQTIKNAPEGELMRLFEYKLEETNVLEKEYAKEMFDKQLLENYGFAIEKYLVWLVPNLEEAKKTINDIQRKIDIEIGIKQSERFWTSVVACNIAGGIIAKELGIIVWDLMRIY